MRRRIGRGDAPCRPESEDFGDGEAELRRGIAAAWWRNPRGKQRGKREEAEGFKGEGSGRRGVPSIGSNQEGNRSGRNGRGVLKMMTSQ